MSTAEAGSTAETVSTAETGSTAPRRIAVVGSGIAGLYGALLAAEGGAAVTLLTKGALEQSNTRFAQGGICAVLGSDDAAPGDSVEAHIADTLRAGAGHCDPDAVRILCTEAKDDIARLEQFGVAFDTDASSGGRALGLEAAHSAARILHAGGDATGAVIAQALIGAVLARAAGVGIPSDGLPDRGPAGGVLTAAGRVDAAAGRIAVLEQAFMTELTTAGGRVRGVRYVRDGAVHQLDADAVLLSTGGAGRMFEHTTNPSVATGDGVAAAWRAGAVVADTEFFQFHPTALAVPGDFMISEAVRGAGAVLRDAAGYRFMPDYHPDAELAPRDVVSRSIALHLSATGAGPEDTVFLDATGVEAERGLGYLAARFPTIDAAVRRLGFDWTCDRLPVIPAAHYWMGGVATDLHGRTSLPGLYAAGEVACTGVHGANRLASNSLLEGLVFARRAVAAFAASSGVDDLRAAGSVDAAPAAGFAADPIVLGSIEVGDRPHIAATSPEKLAAVHVLQPLQSTHAGSETRQAFDVAELRRLMGGSASLIRDGAGLDVAAKQLESWAAAPAAHDTVGHATEGRAALERRNLLTAARLLVHAAGHRSASLGAHFRSDTSAADGGPLTWDADPYGQGPSRNFWVCDVGSDTPGAPGAGASDPDTIKINGSEQP